MISYNNESLPTVIILFVIIVSVYYSCVNCFLASKKEFVIMNSFPLLI